ncbi:MAG TPA: hypothetical protein DCL49_14435 [Candidatus Omnitrophica bacterium]|nr:hypothetical protein [Candidatus Omnitrophota bacterium]
MSANINPSLIHGLALQWASAKYPEELSNRYQRERLDVRVYDVSGVGYYFISGHGPGKWYYKNQPEENHYTNTQISNVQEVIDAGGRVQITGDRGKSFGVWSTWEKFSEEILK